MGASSRLVLRRITMALLLFAVVLGTGACGRQHRDTRLVKVTHLQPVEMAGQTLEAVNDTTVLWLGHRMARSDSPNGSFILREDTGMLYTIDHAAKLYVAIPLADLGDLPKLLGITEDDPDNPDRQLQLMRNFTELYAQVRPTEQFAEIAGYRCRRYEMNLLLGRARIATTYWVTRETDVDTDLLRRITSAALLNLPGADQMIDEMEKMDGLTVLTEGSMEFLGKTTHTSSRLIEITYGDAPPGTFTVPDSYRRQNFSLPVD